MAAAVWRSGLAAPRAFAGRARADDDWVGRSKDTARRSRRWDGGEWSKAVASAHTIAPPAAAASVGGAAARFRSQRASTAGSGGRPL